MKQIGTCCLALVAMIGLLLAGHDTIDPTAEANVWLNVLGVALFAVPVIIVNHIRK